MPVKRTRSVASVRKPRVAKGGMYVQVPYYGGEVPLLGAGRQRRGGLAPVPPEGGRRPRRRVAGGLAPLPAEGGRPRRAPRRAAGGLAPLPAEGGRRPRRRAVGGAVHQSAAQKAHTDYVRAHVNQMSGSTPQQRMAQVNAEWRASR